MNDEQREEILRLLVGWAAIFTRLRYDQGDTLDEIGKIVDWKTERLHRLGLLPEDFVWEDE